MLINMSAKTRSALITIAFLLSVFAFTGQTYAQEAWWDEDWLSRRQITLNNASSSENLINFPILVKLDSSSIDYSKTQNSGQDLRFVDADGSTELSYEIETWNE